MKKKPPKVSWKKMPFLTAGLLLLLLFLLFLLVLQIYFAPKDQKISDLIKLPFKQQMAPAQFPPKLLPTPTPTPIPYTPQTYGNQLRVPILLYHYIGNNPKSSDIARDSISLGPDKFEEQMKYLAEGSFVALTLDTLYPALKKQITLPNKPVILTFDDGYMDFYYNAYPILKKYNLHATVFIPTALMNQGYYLTWAQIKEMASSGLVTFGSHSVHHYNLTTLSIQAVDSELQESKKVLQDNLGIPINFMAYPYGTVSSSVIEEVKKAGYIGALGTWANKIQSEGTIYDMPRLKIGGNIDLQTFISLL